jgi:hypothetical protein
VICLLKLGEGTAQLLIVMLDTTSAGQQSDVKLLAEMPTMGRVLKLGMHLMMFEKSL